MLFIMMFWCRKSSTFDFVLVRQKTDRTFTSTRLSLTIIVIEVKMTSVDSYCAFFSFRYFYYYYYYFVVVVIIITTRRNSYTGHFGHVQNQNWFHTRTHIRQLIRELSLLCVLFGERWRRLPLPPRLWRSVGRNIFN